MFDRIQVSKSKLALYDEKIKDKAERYLKVAQRSMDYYKTIEL